MNTRGKAWRSRVARRLGRYEVIDNGPEFVAEERRKCVAKLGTRTLHIEPGSPWENGTGESVSGKLRDECLKGGIFYSLKEAQVVIEKWRMDCNRKRPHSTRLEAACPAACSLMVPSATSQPSAGDAESLAELGTKLRLVRKFRSARQS
jgi:putative transposase